MLSRLLARVLVAKHGHDTKFDDATERTGSNVWTARVVTHVFAEDLFLAILGPDARLYRHDRNGIPPSEMFFVNLFCEKVVAWASDFGVTFGRAVA
jgi:hypothetical protein